MPRKRRSTTGEIANKIIPIRLTASEHATVQQQAGALSLSEYFRRAGLGLKITTPRSRPPVPEINRQSYLELGRIGNNLNQLTKACHTAHLQGQALPIDRQLLDELSEQISQLRLAVLGIRPEDEDDEARDDP